MYQNKIHSFNYYSLYVQYNILQFSTKLIYIYIYTLYIYINIILDLQDNTIKILTKINYIGRVTKSLWYIMLFLCNIFRYEISDDEKQQEAEEFFTLL
jgi:hypothetical protein